MLPGLFSPAIIAIYLVLKSKNKQLKSDLKNRIFNFRLIKPKYLLAIFFTMPLALLVSIGVALLLGKSLEQYSLASEFIIINGEAFLSLFILFLAPTMEEIGWRGYGVESLKNTGSLFRQTVIFALLWNLWHLPLFFSKGNYQYELLQANPLYALNFVISLFPASILMNWIFYKNNRSVLAIIIFHFMLNFFSVIFQTDVFETEQFTKTIITVVLFLISLLVLIKEKTLFFDRSVINK